MPKFISDVVMAINKNLNKNQRKLEESVSKNIFPSNSYPISLKDMYLNGLIVFLTFTICRGISIRFLLSSKLKFTHCESCCEICRRESHFFHWQP